MPSEKTVLKSSDYKIQGNFIRAFYDAHEKLVFVLDMTVNDIKPNVLLVMSSYGDRKWDDVLSNDYGMDLELVRPKKDNKYQKLDVEYDGLVVYDNLIRAYKDKEDLKTVLHDLDEFRAVSAHRSASERLTIASAIAENARETIERTGDTIVELQAKIKSVRAKITTLRRAVGKEPTKQSAAKILKAEAQLDVLTGKLERAKKRLENANKRLLTAEDDMDTARKVLDLTGSVDENKKFKTLDARSVVAPVKQEEIKDDRQEDNTEDEKDDDFWLNDDDDASDKDSNTDSDAKNDTDIKPLFDKDPNILDEKIAFKPINFDESFEIKAPEVEEKSAEVMVENVVETESEQKNDNTPDYKDDEPVVPVMEFEPPTSAMGVVNVPESYETETDVKLDDVFSGGANDEIKYDVAKPEIEEPVAEESEAQPVDEVPVLNSLTSVDTDSNDSMSNALDDNVSENKSEGLVAGNNDDSVAKEIVMPAPVKNVVSSENLVRPMSPNAQIVRNVPQAETQQHHKPGLLYYVLLLVLIALSVFTLWLYQRSNVSADAVPELVDDNTPVLTQSDDAIKSDETVDDENPFIASGDEKDLKSAPFIENAVEGSLNKIAQMAGAQPVAVADVVESEPDVVEPVSEVEVQEEVNEVEEEQSVAPAPTVVNKPEYKVTQENVFTADSSSDIVGGNLCDGDVAPDANGCCPGETYSTVNEQKVCCPDDGGSDCYTPMF